MRTVAYIPQRESCRNVHLVNYLKFCATLKNVPIRTIKDESPVGSPSGERRDKEDLAVSLPSFRPPLANHALRLRLMDGPAVQKPFLPPPNTQTHTAPPPPPCTHLPQAWIGYTSVYLFISFNTLLYLLHCSEAGEIDQYLIFRAQDW